MNDETIIDARKRFGRLHSKYGIGAYLLLAVAAPFIALFALFAIVFCLALFAAVLLAIPVCIFVLVAFVLPWAAAQEMRKP